MWSPQVIYQFLVNSSLPRLDEEAVKVLDADISLCEIQMVITQFPNDKAPGLDWFGVGFYKKYHSIIVVATYSPIYAAFSS